MPYTHTWRFRVRTYEIDLFNHVNNVNYLNYLEEAATQASTAAGYPMQWYLDNGLIWIVKKWYIRYHHPAVYGDELEIRTWVSDARRVRSYRDYHMLRVSDGATIVRARTDWVFVERDTLRPHRIPDDFETAFDMHHEPLEDLGIQISNPQVYDDTHVYTTTRNVQIYEIDQAQHVNNSVYLRWIEQAYTLAVESAGWSIYRQLEEYNFAILAGGHEIEYFKPAVWGNRIRIESRVVHGARVRGAWIHEIYNDATNELLVRDYAVGIFVQVDGDNFKPTRIPQQMLEDVLRGGNR